MYKYIHIIDKLQTKQIIVSIRQYLSQIGIEPMTSLSSLDEYSNIQLTSLSITSVLLAAADVTTFFTLTKITNVLSFHGDK